mgnify:CR=1 FL=1
MYKEQEKANQYLYGKRDDPPVVGVELIVHERRVALPRKKIVKYEQTVCDIRECVHSCTESDLGQVRPGSRDDKSRPCPLYASDAADAPPCAAHCRPRSIT